MVWWLSVNIRKERIKDNRSLFLSLFHWAHLSGNVAKSFAIAVTFKMKQMPACLRWSGWFLVYQHLLAVIEHSHPIRSHFHRLVFSKIFIVNVFTVITEIFSLIYYSHNFARSSIELFVYYLVVKFLTTKKRHGIKTITSDFLLNSSKLFGQYTSKATSARNDNNRHETSIYNHQPRQMLANRASKGLGLYYSAIHFKIQVETVTLLQ